MTEVESIENDYENKSVKLSNILNLQSTIVRHGSLNNKLSHIPYKEMVKLKPGYYSEIVLTEKVNPDKENTFKSNLVTYQRKDEVELKVNSSPNLEKLKRDLTFGKNLFSQGDIAQIVLDLLDRTYRPYEASKDSLELYDLPDLKINRRNTLKTSEGMVKLVNKDIINRFDLRRISIQDDTIILTQSLESDIPIILYCTIYALTYTILVSNKCEESIDYKIIKNTLESADLIYDDKIKNKIVEHINNHVNIILATYVGDQIIVTQQKIGNAGIDKKVNRVLTLFRELLNKIDYIMAGQTEELENYRILSEYIEYVLGHETDFYKLIYLIINEELYKDKEYLRDRLIIDKTPIETQALRIVMKALDYELESKHIQAQLKEKLSEVMKAIDVSKTLNNNDAIMKNIEHSMQTASENITLTRDLNISKIVNVKYTSIQSTINLAIKPKNKIDEMFRVVFQDHVNKNSRRLIGVNAVKQEIKEEDNVIIKDQIITYRNYDTLKFTFRSITSKQNNPTNEENNPNENNTNQKQLLVEYIKPNMGNYEFSEGDLVWI